MLMKEIVIIGYGGHAKSVIDSISASGKYKVAGYTDIEDKHVTEIPYLGTDECLSLIFKKGVHKVAFGLGFMGKSELRSKLYQQVKKIGFDLPVIIDPSAVVSSSAQIGEGTFIGKRAVVNAEAVVGKMCIINTGSLIEHENRIGDFTHIAVGAVLCGNVSVGEQCLIGANSTIIQGITVEDYSIVGAGSVVINNIAKKETVVGIPAKIIRR